MEETDDRGRKNRRRGPGNRRDSARLPIYIVANLYMRRGGRKSGWRKPRHSIVTYAEIRDLVQEGKGRGGGGRGRGGEGFKARGEVIRSWGGNWGEIVGSRAPIGVETGEGTGGERGGLRWGMGGGGALEGEGRGEFSLDLYGHFGLVRLSRLGHDVPWVKA